MKTKTFDGCYGSGNAFLEKVFTRVRNINGNILYIILRLENAKKIPYLYQVPVLRNYINVDRAIVGDIIQKYKYIFN